jgi:hypothetical protein
MLQPSIQPGMPNQATIVLAGQLGAPILFKAPESGSDSGPCNIQAELGVREEFAQQSTMFEKLVQITWYKMSWYKQNRAQYKFALVQIDFEKSAGSTQISCTSTTASATSHTPPTLQHHHSSCSQLCLHPTLLHLCLLHLLCSHHCLAKRFEGCTAPLCLVHNIFQTHQHDDQ